MCFMSAPSMPAMAPPPLPPAPKPAPTVADPAVGLAMDEERRRRQAARGRASTILTDEQGLTSENDSKGKTLVTA